MRNTANLHSPVLWQDPTSLELVLSDINQVVYASCMIDSGTLAYALVSPSLVKKAGLQCIDIPP
jgi:hypothetical protein